MKKIVCIGLAVVMLLIGLTCTMPVVAETAETAETAAAETAGTETAATETAEMPDKAVTDVAETRVVPLEWSWTPGKVATFEGAVKLPEKLPETVVLRLTVDPEPRQSEKGSIVFTHMNGKRIATRKQAEEYTLSTAGLSGAVPFQGSWSIPQDTYYSAARVTVDVLGEDGSTLESKTFSFSEEDDFNRNGGRKVFRLPFNTNRVILWMSIAAGAVWCLAILRMVITHRKKRSKKGA